MTLLQRAPYIKKKLNTSSLPYALSLGAGLVLDEQKDYTEGTPVNLKELLTFREHLPVMDSVIEHYSWKKQSDLD